MDDCLWRPSPERIARTRLHELVTGLEERFDTRFSGYEALHRWSVEHREDFWSAIWEECGVLGDRGGSTVLVDRDAMPGAKWFPGARLSFAENLLRKQDDSPALVFRNERGDRREWSWQKLHDEVARLARALRETGVKAGDRIAGFMPNLPEAVAASIAGGTFGAVWSSSSPDFGVQGVLDRFAQIEPKVLFAADGYFYNGARHDCLERLAAIAAGLPTLERVVVVPYASATPAIEHIPKAVLWDDYVGTGAAGGIEITRLPFDHPLYVLYSSGTTGIPKCIVHGAGGTLLQHLKEHQLHVDLWPGDRLFYFTTCGWMMWTWLVSGLATGATIVLYDGSPFHPGPNVLFDVAAEERVTTFGTSAKFLDAVQKRGLDPARTHDLSAVDTILSTGSPLAPESFDFVYDRVKADVHLATISGGTDLISCFVLGNPTLPVHRGEAQCSGLGMAVDVFDDDGRSVREGAGELVCTAPFPSVPLGFLGDPDGARFRATYFERFPGVWTHGDWVERTSRGGMIIHGRSDATLNPGGVRIGTAEIYRQVETLDEVLECLAIGQSWENDVRVVLFVKLREGLVLDDALVAKIKKQIRDHATPRHVPARILQVADLPRTKSGKITELAVRDVVHGRTVKNVEALANPEALEHFRDREELRS